jgi:hypothetical protein
MYILGILALVAVGIVIWLVTSAQNEAKALEAERDALEQYTTQVGSAISSVEEPAAGMAALVALPEDEAGVEALAQDSEAWTTQLQAAQAQVASVLPDRSAQAVNELFVQAISLYSSAAEAFGLVPDAEGDTQEALFRQASNQRNLAGGLFGSAIGVLDQLRRDKGMSASGLIAPGTAQPQAPPDAETGEDDASDTIEIPTEPEDAEGSGDKKKNKKGNKKPGDDSDE